MAITISGTASTTRSNLGLGDCATLNVGTSANNILQLDGSGNLPSVDGSLITGLIGGVLQTQMSSTASSYSYSNTSAAEDTALATTITPSSASSKILVLLTDGQQNQGVNNTAYTRLTRAVSGGSETNISGDHRNETNAGHFGPISLAYLDEPGTTSAITYKRYFWGQGSTMALSMNNSLRTLILIEIDG